MKALSPNTLLQNRYLIIQLIGKGGMGEVYLAVDQRLGSAVALKRTYFADDETLNNAFEREARTLARMRHPVLPKVSDHFVEDENQYLVMEHIAGEDLAKRLENNKKPFPLSWVLYWADQLLDALHYLHSHNPSIIHRDIKPQNLKLSDENNIVLLDFGLAKNEASRSMMNSTGSVVGFTPHYAPMEQIRGLGTNAQSDIYSLSATLYQLATNHIPADALNRADSFVNDLPDSLIPPHQMNPEIPKPISEIIVTGMALNQTQRHASARVMQRLLRESYAQIQSAMAAQTLTITPQEILPTAIEENQFATFVEKPDAAELSPVAGHKNGNGNGFTGQKNADSEPEKAQVAVESPAEVKEFIPPAVSVNEPAKQSNIKTEVYDGGEIDRSLKNVGSFSADAVTSASDFVGGRDLNAEDSFIAAVPPVDESAAYFSTDEAIPVNEISNTAEFQIAGNEAAAAEDFAVHSSEPANAAAVSEIAGNDSNKKFAYIAGGIFALLVIVLGGVVGGWYWSQRAGQTAGSEIPAPTGNITVQPTVEPTTELSTTNSNSADENSNSLMSSANDNASTANSSIELPTVTEPDNSRSTTTVTRPIPPPRPGENPPRNDKAEKPKTPEKPKTGSDTEAKPKKPDSTLINP